ncbi:MFS transporter [Georgenia yuyongxinii]|nr:MFS transporter [Georgenia yuyongxinii]
MTTPTPEPSLDVADPARDDATASSAGTDRPGWRHDVALFLGGQTVSLFGSMLVQYAIMWHLTLETRSGVVMALASVFGFLPQAVLSVFGGVWADRHDRKKLIMTADAVIAASTLGLALLMLSGTSELWLIYATLAIRSAGAGVQTPAVSALLPQIVPTEKLMRVNGVNASIQSAMILLAPAVAALVYANFSIVAVFFVDVVTALIGIGLLAALTVPRLVRATDGARPGYFDDLRDGVRYVTSHRFVRWLLGLFAIVFVLVAAPSGLTPLMMVRTFGEEVWKLTALEVAYGVGMLIGGAVIASWGGLKNRVLMLVGSAFLFGALAVGMGLATHLWVFLALMFVLGVVVPAFSTPAMTVLQETVEPERQGRVFGFVGVVMAVSMPLGMAIFGPLADRFSVESLLVVSGALMFLVTALAVALPSGRRAIAGGVAAVTAEPATAVAAEPPTAAAD